MPGKFKKSRRMISAALSLMMAVTAIPLAGAISASATTYKIWLDAGHGGNDPGAVHYDSSGAVDRYEKNDTLEIVLAVGSILEDHGVSVGYTRTDDSSVALNDRGPLANAFGADYFVSVHRNSASSTSATGLETYYHTSQSSSSEAAQLAGHIQSNVLEATGYTNRGVKTADFSVLRRSNMPAALIETGFISNTDDNAVLDAKKQGVIVAIAKACLTMCGIEYNGSGANVGAYEEGNRTLMLNNCDSTDGWRPEYNTSLQKYVSASPVGYNIGMIANSPVSDPGVGSMAFYEYDSPVDMSDYRYVFLELYSSIDYKNAGRDNDFFQVNFCSGSGSTYTEDGYDINIPASSISAGWQTFTFDMKDIAKVNSSADWRAITRMRYTWFNFSEGPAVEFRLDTVKAYINAGAYEKNGELHLADCDSFKGWTGEHNTNLIKQVSYNPVGYHMVLDAQSWDGFENGVGSMAFYDFDSAADVSDYCYISFEVYSDIDYKNAGRDNDIFQVNFYSAGHQDGYNINIPVSRISQGWQTFTYEKSTLGKAIDDVDWHAITGVRFTWFNFSGGGDVTFAVDTVKAFGSIDVVQLDNCDDASRWGWHIDHQSVEGGQEFWWGIHDYCRFTEAKDLTGLKSLVLNTAAGVDDATDGAQYPQLFQIAGEGGIYLTSYSASLGQGANANVFNADLKNHEAFTTYGCRVTAESLQQTLIDGDNTFAVDLSTAGENFDITNVTGIFITAGGWGHDLCIYNISAICQTPVI